MTETQAEFLILFLFLSMVWGVVSIVYYVTVLSFHVIVFVLNVMLGV